MDARTPVRITIRGYRDRKKIFEDTVDAALEDIGQLAERHAARFQNGVPFMVEIEFIDEADPNQRFFRFGTDPRGMVVPLRCTFEEFFKRES